MTSPLLSPPGVGVPLVISLLSTLFGGCSFAFVNGPPPNHRTSAFFDCTASNTIPVLDTVASTIALLDAVSFTTGSTNDASTTTGSRKGDLIAFGAGAALLATSAAYGYKKTSECRQAEADSRAPLDAPTGEPIRSAGSPTSPTFL